NIQFQMKSTTVNNIFSDIKKIYKKSEGYPHEKEDYIFGWIKDKRLNFFYTDAHFLYRWKSEEAEIFDGVNIKFVLHHFLKEYLAEVGKEIIIFNIFQYKEFEKNTHYQVEYVYVDIESDDGIKIFCQDYSSKIPDFFRVLEGINLDRTGKLYIPSNNAIEKIYYGSNGYKIVYRGDLEKVETDERIELDLEKNVIFDYKYLKRVKDVLGEEVRVRYDKISSSTRAFYFDNGITDKKSFLVMPMKEYGN
ncbi:MAG: hypothetical protein QW474_01580, partial [Candidatus Aenigmatarchaeota archaeon]